MKPFITIAAGIVVLTIAACDSRQHHASSPSTPIGTGSVDEKPPTGKPFPTPQAAGDALRGVVSVPTKAGIEELFGIGATEVIWSGDDVADTEPILKVKTLIDEGINYVRIGDDVVIAEFGKDRRGKQRARSASKSRPLRNRVTSLRRPAR